MTSLRSLTTHSLRASALLLVGLALPLTACSSTPPASTSAPAVAPATSEAASPTPSATTASATPMPSPTTSSASAKPTASGYTMAQVRQHDSAKSCWTVISGNVYDLTKWVNRHPGGPAVILGLCGTDGTAAFRAQHGTQGEPNQMLAGYKLGKLA